MIIKRDKNGRLDLRAVVNDNIECDIEVQLSIHEKMLPRFLLLLGEKCIVQTYK